MVYRGFRLGVLAAVALTMSTTQGVGQATAPSGYTETLRWYHERAEAGDARAQFLLAIKYETGTDVRRDLSIAADLYESAARQGHADSQFKLATLLAARPPSDARDASILSWYRAAALQGHAPAQYNLGVVLLNTAPDPDTLVEATSWVVRAARSGLAPAKTMQDQLLAQLPEDAAMNARRLAEVPLSQK